MKSSRVSAVVLILTLAGLGGWAWADIEGSKHDFSNTEWSEGNACWACHSPEHDQPASVAPLWEENADLNRTFGTPLARSKSAGARTMICLRCHDGTIARDTIAQTTRPRFVNLEHPGLFRTGHGTVDHPVGVEYPQLDKGFRAVTSVLATKSVTLPGGMVECMSCHDPHDMSGEKYMLVAGNARSALCLTCHKK